MKKLITTLAPTLLLGLPVVASAQLGEIGSLIGEIRIIIVQLPSLLIGIALIVFFWGLVKFIFAQGSESVRADAKKIMLWGLVALFVMISVWGIITFFQQALGVPATSAPPTLPTI
jgi:hypothetical protein